MHQDVFRPKSFNTHHEETEKLKRQKVSIEGIDVMITDRELGIIQMIVDGKDNKEIGTALFIAEGTVKNTITTITSKLQLKDRTQLAVFAIRNFLV